MLAAHTRLAGMPAVLTGRRAQGVRACPESPVALVETVVGLANTLLEEKDACNGLRALMNRTINRQDRVYARAVAEVRAFWIACMQGTRPDVQDPWLQGALARTVEGHARRLAEVTSACLPMSMDHADMVQRAAAALAASAHSERAQGTGG